MRKIQYGSVLLDRYRGNILMSTTKTNVTIEKDGETYEAGTRNLPVGTYTVTATPKGTAELTTLEVNGNSFVSGGTVNIGFGGNLNVVAVSEGGEPAPITDLTGTKWKLNDTISAPEGEGDIHWSVAGNCEHPLVPDGLTITSLGKFADFTDINLFIGGQPPIYYYPDYEPHWWGGEPWDGSEIAPLIEFTGGRDVTNQALITWLQANAVQVIDSTSVTNLTNTTWVFKSTINTYETGTGTWNIKGNAQNSAYPNKMIVDILGTSSLGQFYLADEQENNVIMYSQGWIDMNWDSCSQPTLHITGGIDASNETAINWIKQNAYLVKETE